MLFGMFEKDKIRNIAIIAHIDHGKTTLMDSLLQQSQVFADHEKVPDRVMDSYDQERERGITIFSKNTSVFYKDYKINIIDTPGHADFSGEVERVLIMVNSVLLLVDAKEGPMPQTRFVLKKALAAGLKPIVVLNKIDRPGADPENAINMTFDLFVELGATDEQLDFEYCYASGLDGFAMRKLDDPRDNLGPLFDMIVEHVPAPEGDKDAPLLMQAATIDYDSYLGRQACGRISAGVAKKGDPLVRIDHQGNRQNFKIVKIDGHHGLQKVELQEAGVGDIVTLSGVEDVTIGDVLCAPTNQATLPPITIEEPTLSINFMVNSGPFAGREGKHVTMNKIRERLLQEKRSNVTLGIEEKGSDKIEVAGRGELHLAVLMEAMRREGFEFVVSKPQVIIKQIDGQKQEPIEQVHIEVPTEYSGAIIEEVCLRKGEMQHLENNEHGISRIDFFVPTRGLIGLRSELMTLSRGLAIVTSIYDHYAPWKGEIPSRKQGVLISMGPGQVNGYACNTIQKRGVLFVKPGDEVYEGMIVGEHSRDNDLMVNIIKGKQLTNVRASGKDESILLTPPRVITLEESINFIENDEWVEVTPKSIRLRKQVLGETDRKRASR
ncbi:MAG: GTP-binding protein TypA/BipA [Chlamydiales bacterium]|nr:GTP-binding protein TypA/BipA [Chlamydiales bacterium]MCH9635335.1 GTP-binding protein TypA/BipA [Chlamydiales bacterium]